jgi:hypothetical protein
VSALVRTSTTQVLVKPEHIPAEAVAVTWQRVAGEQVWHYRMHRTVLGAKRQHGKDGRAYDRETYLEWGWKTISDVDRDSGFLLW